MKRKKKRKRRKIPRYKKVYKTLIQDKVNPDEEIALQKVYKELSEYVFKDFPFTNIGDWQIEFENLTLFIDPQFGNQLEIKDTSKMSVSKRLKIHLGLFEFLKGGHSLSKAIKMSLAI